MPQNDKKCCSHDCCENKKEEDITVEEAVKILTEDIPAFLRMQSDEFHVYEPFWDIINDRDTTRLSEEVSGEGYHLRWELKLWKGCPPSLSLFIEYTGGNIEIHETYGRNREDTFRRLITTGFLSTKAVKALSESLNELKTYKWGRLPGITEWRNEIDTLIIEKAGLTKDALVTLRRHTDSLHRLYRQKKDFIEGIEEAVEALKDTKSITKSPAIKEIRENLELALDPSKHAYEFYNN